jgi:hypothetical protein
LAFELTLRNLGLVSSYPGRPLPSADNQLASPGVPHGLGHSMRAAQRSLRLGPSPAGHGPDRPYRGLKPADLPTSHAWDGLRERDSSLRLRPGSLPGSHMNQPWTTVPKQPRPGRSEWTKVTLVSDSFPRKRKPPPRVTLPVGMTHQQVECRVNLQAGARVPPSGTPPGPYSAYTCPSPGAMDRSCLPSSPWTPPEVACVGDSDTS